MGAASATPIAASSDSHRRRRHLGRPHGRKAPVQAGTAGELRRHHAGGGAGAGAGAGAGDALRGVLAGDAWAWAGTTTDSTMGLNHLEGMRMATVAPPTNILSTRRRVVLPSLIGIPRSESHRRAVDRSRVESKRAPNAESRKAHCDLNPTQSGAAAVLHGDHHGVRRREGGPPDPAIHIGQGLGMLNGSSG
jgi:hypothetical protein